MTSTTESPAWQKTACILCECNCGLEVALDGRRLAKIRGDKEHPESQGYTCEKPLRLDYYQNGQHRLDTPMRRRPDGTYEPIGWATALDEIAARLSAVRAEHGGESIAFYGGGGQGNHLQGAHGRALMNALGVRLYSNALAQEKTGEAWVDEPALRQPHHRRLRAHRGRGLRRQEPLAVARRRTLTTHPA
ncbi:molybdopterin-dependent oxidoreductase [Nocardioides convexus]|uniref:molybdopterin-dependent oxidoreductase n=1 Tax=Nocardioides convexus TaxID=2712224 RepID=UPI0024189FE2|nr:molybdopterin-dependent oxidoreductase [Nocardioides convexus]